MLGIRMPSPFEVYKKGRQHIQDGEVWISKEYKRLKVAYEAQCLYRN